MNEMKVIDFDNLPNRGEVEDLVGQMDVDEVLMNLNNARARTLKAEGDVPEDEVYTGIVLVQRFRSLRETKKTSKSKPTKPTPTLQGLMDL